MAKWNKTQVGTIWRSKTPGGAPVMKIKNDVTLKAGQYVNLESKAMQIASLEKAINEGKIKNPEQIQKARERLENMPEGILFEVNFLTKTGE